MKGGREGGALKGHPSKQRKGDPWRVTLQALLKVPLEARADSRGGGRRGGRGEGERGVELFQEHSRILCGFQTHAPTVQVPRTWMRQPRVRNSHE